MLVLRSRPGLGARLGAVIAAVPMSRLLIDSVVRSGGATFWASALTFLLDGGPALLVLGLSFSPALTRWRRKRQRTVADDRDPASRGPAPPA